MVGLLPTTAVATAVAAVVAATADGKEGEESCHW